MIERKYFFGSDERSLPFLSSLNNKYENLNVITLPPKQKGRGRKLMINPVEEFCIKNNLLCSYFDEDKYYEDMEFAIVASFAKIFSKNFITTNAPLFNIHLSLLPKLRGPTPVETAILNNETETGYTIFQINENTDSGNIIFQNKIEIQNKYASDVYQNIYTLFNNDLPSINFFSNGIEQDINYSTTSKFIKKDFNLTSCTVDEAKNKIRAFDTLGPAFILFNNKYLKIHSYSDEEITSRIELIDGFLYPLKVTPEGKRMMTFTDYIRGLR